MFLWTWTINFGTFFGGWGNECCYVCMCWHVILTCMDKQSIEMCDLALVCTDLRSGLLPIFLQTFEYTVEVTVKTT